MELEISVGTQGTANIILFSPNFDDTEWSGINALLYYGPTLVRSVGLRGDTVTLLVSGGIGIVQLIAVLPAIVWIDRIGRRPLLRGKLWYIFIRADDMI